ncbi:MAG: dolichyl-phosphate-mannose-protein mannosyltransferase, partial [Frankiaceae bacterium]|nr:dolichyl-phosphate-mannose-protein mannosyltransferase [Frankiaceae bacterium]
MSGVSSDVWSAVPDTDTERPAGIPDRLARLRRPLPDDGWWGWGIPLLITAIGLFLRLYRITRPHGKVFDETYYAGDAWSLLHHGVELNKDGHAAFIAHPPLGKWLIAIGEAMFGNNELGWRFSAAIVGSLSILLIARIARRMFRSTVLGCIAALLLSLDGLEFVQSRTSMLDIFLMFWVLAAFGCLVLDRDDGRRRVAQRLEHGDRIGFLGLRPWRIACGLCLGAAFATKWDGAFWIPAFLLLAMWWDVGARRVAGDAAPVGNGLLYDGFVALVPFVVLPVIVYVASWTGWFVSDGVHAYDHDKYVHAGQSWITHGFAVLHGWWAYHQEMWSFHRNLAAAHPYLSNPWGWLLLARPVSYYYQTPKGCGAASCSQEVLGIGTPLIWWLSIPALLAVAWRMLGRFDWRAAAIMVSFLFGYVIWIFEETQVVPNCHPADNCHRTMFLFYLLPDVPFMVLALTMAIGMLLATRAVRTVGEVFGAAASNWTGLTRVWL